MPITALQPKPVPRVWGRRNIEPWFDVGPTADPIGEIWFEGDGASRILVKYLFTSEPLSIQVHPNDVQAQARGLPQGKDEAWLILQAEPDAVIGLGLTNNVSDAALKNAALDGSIEQLVDWKPARRGEIYYSPAGTVHAIGAGLTIIEIQQSTDLTYRLYDYGRPRELHLDDGIAVANRAPYSPPFKREEIGPGRQLVAKGPPFMLELWEGERDLSVNLKSGQQLTLVPFAGEASCGGMRLRAGGVWQSDEPFSLLLSRDCQMLVGYSGGELIELDV
ncbi:MAG TPA: class I mannose-6-phosphate isomerase [Allosphingosinicella sp.]|uniref:class I mannose-6-phosphate isomerase n=1 Tax=Allosphingosinicella sp. TaxID=2823234 RepID=UPI002ED7C1AD